MRKPEPRALIYEDHFHLMARWMLDYPGEETGGDLFGFWTHSGFPVVQHVLGPGPCARRSTTAFYQDRDYLLREGHELQDAHGLQHIGEWHSHHTLGLAEPSSGDCTTVRRAMRDFSLPGFLLVIGQLTRSGTAPLKPEFNGFLFHGREPVAVGFVCLNGVSPLQGGVKQDRSRLADVPRQAEFVIGRRVPLGDAVPLTPERPSFEEDAWMRTPSGREMLREMDQRLRLAASDVRFFDDKGQLVLTFSINSVPFRVAFPKEFPRHRPLMTTVDADGRASEIPVHGDPKEHPLSFIEGAMEMARHVQSAKPQARGFFSRWRGRDGMDG